MSGKKLYIPEVTTIPATPATPGAGFTRSYFKNDGFLYMLDNLGVERRIWPQEICQVFNTDTTTNLNASTSALFPTQVPITGTQDRVDPAFTVTGDFIQCNFDGIIEVYANVHMFTTAARPSVQLRLRRNTELIGPIGSTGYIRDSAGHQETSVHVHMDNIVVSNGDLIGLFCRREAGAGTVTMTDAGTSNMVLKRSY